MAEREFQLDTGSMSRCHSWSKLYSAQSLATHTARMSHVDDYEGICSGMRPLNNPSAEDITLQRGLFALDDLLSSPVLVGNVDLEASLIDAPLDVIETQIMEFRSVDGGRSPLAVFTSKRSIGKTLMDEKSWVHVASESEVLTNVSVLIDRYVQIRPQKQFNTWTIDHIDYDMVVDGDKLVHWVRMILLWCAKLNLAAIIESFTNIGFVTVRSRVGSALSKSFFKKVIRVAAQHCNAKAVYALVGDTDQWKPIRLNSYALIRDVDEYTGVQYSDAYAEILAGGIASGCREIITAYQRRFTDEVLNKAEFPQSSYDEPHTDDEVHTDLIDEFFSQSKEFARRVVLFTWNRTDRYVDKYLALDSITRVDLKLLYSAGIRHNRLDISLRLHSKLEYPYHLFDQMLAIFAVKTNNVAVLRAYIREMPPGPKHGIFRDGLNTTVAAVTAEMMSMFIDEDVIVDGFSCPLHHMFTYYKSSAMAFSALRKRFLHFYLDRLEINQYVLDKLRKRVDIPPIRRADVISVMLEHGYIDSDTAEAYTYLLTYARKRPIDELSKCSLAHCPNVAVFVCSDCHAARYCSESCANVHWRGEHRRQCL